MRRALLLLGIVGCYHPTPGAGAPCGPDDACPSSLSCVGGFCVEATTDADTRFDTSSPQDDSPVSPDGCVSFSQQFDTCALPAGGPAAYNGIEFSYNTDTGELEELDVNGNVVGTTNPTHVLVTGLAGPIDVLIVSSFTLGAGAEFGVTGSHPFGIVSTGPVNILGRIDAEGGAGHRGSGTCSSTAGKSGTNNTLGGGGGGGGAFAKSGATGGNGAGAGGTAGAGSSIMPPGPLGGCPGGRGGSGSMSNTGGSGGSGGGAVYIVSAAEIGVPTGGIIEAGGNGGIGGAGTGSTGMPGLLGGGGGGGSGGMVWLEAPLVIIRGALVANGGGGGEGAGLTAAGNTGQRGRTTSASAMGGAGGDAVGGDGGGGGAATGAGPGANQTSGGGGGGGVGFIKIQGTPDVAGSTISPPPS